MPQAAIKSPEELKKVFADRGVDLTQPVVASCGSGKTLWKKSSGEGLFKTATFACTCSTC